MGTDKHDSDNDQEIEEMMVTLTLEDDTEVECDVLAIFPMGDTDYIALSPTNNATEEDEVILFRFKELENDEAEILNIEDDDEYEAAIEMFEELMEDSEESEWDDILEAHKDD